MKNRWKNFWALGLGLSFIILLELGLRLFNFSFSKCDFDPFVSFREEVPVLVEDEKAKEKRVGINPLLKDYFNPISFAKDKPERAQRIFILGGSSALGFPFGEQGAFSEFLSQGLNQLDTGHSYQVINLAGFGYASYRVLRLLKEVSRYQPDLVIIMTGDNEFLEKREYEERIRFLWLREKLAGFRIYCCLKQLVYKLVPEPKKPMLGAHIKWEHYIIEPEMKEMVIKHFQFNLQEMAKICQNKKIPTLFLTSPANLKNFPPYYSLHKKGITEKELKQWADYLFTAEQAMVEKNYELTIMALEEALEIDPEYAYTWFLLGKAELEKKEFEKAKSAFSRALEKDAWQVRTISAFNQAVRELKGQKIWVLDLIPVFSAQSPDGIPGKNVFYDHCHPRLEAHALIAKEIIQKLGEINWIALPLNWEKSYEDKISDYLASLSSSFLAQGYYNLAVEIGINMGLKKLAQEYLEAGLKLDQENPNLKKLKVRLQ